MRLHTREWGTGRRVALLVHGLMSDHRTWRRVGPALADRGYRVIAVDLRGHGESGRGRYRLDEMAGDLTETLPADAELALGHSLGALALSRVVDRLRPARAVYADPAWGMRGHVAPVVFSQLKAAPARLIGVFNPRWEPVDAETEAASIALWDEASAAVLRADPAADRVPARPVVPSLVLTADPSRLVPEEQRRLLVERGFEVRTVPGAGHNLHRDDFDGFMAALRDWV
ncbi:hydrolase [Streptomyces albus subsp. albus]|nr:hydrolase [Streptomyces albus subsp. albus]